MTHITLNTDAALVEARKNSPDWQVAQSISTALRIGQLHLDTAIHLDPATDTALKRMQPEHQAAALDLLERWRQLNNDALGLVAHINTELTTEVQA